MLRTSVSWNLCFFIGVSKISREYGNCIFGCWRDSRRITGLFMGCEEVRFFAVGVTDEPTACPGFAEGGKGTCWIADRAVSEGYGEAAWTGRWTFWEMGRGRSCTGYITGRASQPGRTVGESEGRSGEIAEATEYGVWEYGQPDFPAEDGGIQPA